MPWPSQPAAPLTASSIDHSTRLMRASNRSAALFALLLFTPDFIRCAEPEDGCSQFETEDFARLPDGELPAWAVGSFGYYEIDVRNYNIAPNGRLFVVLDGGDAGGCGTGTVAVQGGFVDVSLGAPRGDRLAEKDGAYFIQFRPDECWRPIQREPLCGRDVGGCGGYGSAVVCSAEEAFSRCDEDEV